jgi:phage protein U
MANVTMALGDHVFYMPYPDQDTPSFDTIAFDSNFTWIAQNRLSREPAMQFSGPGEESINISGRLFPNHFGGIPTLNAMRDSGRAGKLMQLIRFYPLLDPAGMGGSVIGLFGIRRIKVDERKIGSNGVAHQLDFSMELIAYGEDAKSQTQFLYQEAT